MTNQKSGLTLVEIMIVVAIIAALAAVAIPNWLRVRISSNEALAKKTVQAMSTAAETFSASNSGDYPTAFSDLTGAAPPYLSENFCGVTKSGYTFTCPTMTMGSYTFVGTPTTPGTTGNVTYTISTGGVIAETP